MKQKEKRTLRAGLISPILFGLWTALIQFVDVLPKEQISVFQPSIVGSII